MLIILLDRIFRICFFCFLLFPRSAGQAAEKEKGNPLARKDYNGDIVTQVKEVASLSTPLGRGTG
jgi:hypothetical protein